LTVERVCQHRLTWYNTGNSAIADKPRATRLEVRQGHQTIRYVRYGFLLVCYSNFVPKTRRFWYIQVRKMWWHWNPR